MNDDERAALHWLLKGNDSYAVGPQPGLAALVHLLKEDSLPLNFYIRHALAHALEPLSVGETRLVMTARKGRGRPSNDVRSAANAHEMEAKRKEGKAAGEKQKSLVTRGASHATVYRQLKMARRRPKPLKTKAN